MHLCSILAALLILQCSIPLALAGSPQQGTSSHHSHVSSYTAVGTVTFKGSKLRVYDIDGARVAEPRVGFTSTCGSLRYNHLYLKYQLSIPIHIDANTMTSSGGDSHTKVGRVTLTDLKVIADKALSSRGSRVTAMAQVRRSGQGLLILLCDSFDRCQDLRDEVAANPEELRRAVRFVPIGFVGGATVRFSAARSASAPRIGYCNHGRWIVFQRRVDGSLSFARNWDDYVRGFGNPKTNYWMGLNRLFAMTVTSKKNGYSDSYRCRLRMEAEDFQGKNYWGEFGIFEVLSPQEKYRLRIGKIVHGSTINLMWHNGMQFSTYDRDHDRYGAGSCSRSFGYGGWWYNACHHINLNGAYTTDKSITNHPNYISIHYAGRHIPLKKTVMKFKCN